MIQTSLTDTTRALKNRLPIIVLFIGASLLASCALHTRKLYQNVDPQMATLVGKWQLQLTGPIRARFPVEFIAAKPSDSVRCAPLDNIPVTFSSGTFDKGVLKMGATAPQGEMTMELRVVNDRVVGTWRSVVNPMLSGTIEADRYRTASASSIHNAAVAQAVWKTIDRKYYEPNFNGLDWKALRARFIRQVASAPDDASATVIINSTLRRLGSSHVGFAPLPANSPTTSADTANTISWKRVSPRVGYLRISRFPQADAGSRARIDIDRAMSELADAPSLVIDIRDNPGGTLDLAARMAYHLSTQPIEVGYFASRAGLQKNSASSMEALESRALPRLLLGDSVTGANLFAHLERRGGAAMLIAGGSNARPYRGSVVLLINGSTASTAEAFAGALRESLGAHLFGTPSAGAMLASVQIRIAKGWALRYPEYDYRTAHGVKVEGRGIRPDSVTGKALPDNVLGRAIRFAETLSSSK